MPYTMWRVLTIGIYGYRFAVLPLLIKLTGYAKYVDWVKPKLGSAQPKPDSWEAAVYEDLSLSTKGRLAAVNFGDSKFENMVYELYLKTTHLSPHTQSPGHPLVQGFPGNFMNHLTGVYKILVGESIMSITSHAYFNPCYDMSDAYSVATTPICVPRGIIPLCVWHFRLPSWCV
jgi:hypothetical protein